MTNLLFFSYVFIWFSIIHDYLCQCKIQFELIYIHGHEKTHVNLFFHFHVGGQGKIMKYGGNY
jgi:hypothetical protein